MKSLPVISAATALALGACETMKQPITSGDFDPLRPPGSNYSDSTSVVEGGFRGGDFVVASMDQTAFFKNRPSGDADADKLLPQGTSMKVITSVESYTKVELDSGEVGWVPSVLLDDPNAVQEAFPAPDGAIQVYPPLDDPSATLPENPGELPPDGAIPTVIDPEASSTLPPLPPNGEEDEEEEKPAEEKPAATEESEKPPAAEEE